jgi:hypothetical protein
MEKSFEQNLKGLIAEIEEGEKSESELRPSEKLKKMLEREGVAIMSKNENGLKSIAWLNEETFEGKTNLTLTYIDGQGKIFEFYEFDPKEFGISRSEREFAELQITFNEAGITLTDKDDNKIREIRKKINDTRRKIEKGEKISPDIINK